MSSQRKFKYKGSTLDSRRQERIENCERMRQTRRALAMQRIRESLLIADEEEEEEDEEDVIDIYDPELIAQLFADVSAHRIMALQAYSKEILKCSPEDASSVMSDMGELGVVAGFMESLVAWPIDSAVCAQALQTILCVTQAVEDKEMVADWFEYPMLERLANICHPAFAATRPTNADATETALTILNYMLAGNRRFFRRLTAHNFPCNVMQIFQQRLYFDGFFGGNQPFPYLRTLLIFLNVFYYEAAQVDFQDNLEDYLNLLNGILKHLFNFLDSLEDNDIAAKILMTSGSAPASSTNFVALNGQVLLALGEEALYSLSYFLTGLTSATLRFIMKMAVFGDHVRLLMQFLHLFRVRYMVLGTRCRKSITMFFKSAFFHITELTRNEYFVKMLFDNEVVLRLWDVLQNAARARPVSDDDAVVVVDPADVDDMEGSFTFCMSTARDTLIACLTAELSQLKHSGDIIYKYVALFANQLRIAKFAVRREALMAMRTLLIYGDQKIVKFAVSNKIIEPICDMLTVMDVECVLGALDCIRELLLKDTSGLGTSRDIPQPNVYRAMIEEMGVEEKLDFLMRSPNSEVFQLAAEVHAEFLNGAPTSSAEYFSCASASSSVVDLTPPAIFKF